MVASVGDEVREHAQGVAMMSTYIFNHGGPRPQGFTLRREWELFPHLFTEKKQAADRSYRSRMEAAMKQAEVYAEQRAKADARRARENDAEDNTDV